VTFLRLEPLDAIVGVDVGFTTGSAIVAPEAPTVPSRRPNVALNAAAIWLTGGSTPTVWSWRSIYDRESVNVQIVRYRRGCESTFPREARDAS